MRNHRLHTGEIEPQLEAHERYAGKRDDYVSVYNDAAIEDPIEKVHDLGV